MNWWDEYPDADTAVAEAPATNWWDEFPDAPETADPSYLSQLGTALSIGGRQTVAGTRGTFNALTGDTEELGANLATLGALQRETAAAETPADKALNAAFAQNAAEFQAAKGFWPSAKELADYVGITLSNPGAAVKQAVQSLPSSAVSLGAQIVGRGVGGALGAIPGLATGPGAIATGIAGFVGGGVAANTLLEAGPAIYDILNERTNGAAANMTAEQITAALKADPTIASEGLKRGAVRGAVIGGVESLGLAGAGRLAAVPERAAATAARRALTEAGVDVADRAALEVAMATPALREVAEGAMKVAADQYSTAGNVARLAGAAGIETGAAGVGEGTAQVASGQPFDPTSVWQEMMGDLVLSPAAAMAGKGLEVAAGALPTAQNVPQGTIADEGVADLTAADVPERMAPVVDAATNAILVAEEAAPIAPATAETLARIAEQTAVETLASQPDDRAIIAWAITQEKLGVKVPGMNEYDLNNYSENFSTATKNRTISQMREAYNRSLNEPTPETIPEQPLPVGQTQAEVAPENQQIETQTYAPQQEIIPESIQQERESGDQVRQAPEAGRGNRVLSAAGGQKEREVVPGSRVTFMQEGVQRTGELVSLNAGVARVKGDDGVVVQTRAQNLTPLESPSTNKVLKGDKLVVEAATPFSTYLHTVTPTGKWTDSDYAAAQRFADGDGAALQDLSKVKRNAVVRELLAFDTEARAKQDAEDKRIADDFKARNKERPSDAPLLDEALAKISEPLPDDIESASIGGSEAPTAFRSEADYQQELTNRLGITNFSNIVFGNFDPLENGVSLKGFVKQGSDKVYLNLRNLQSAEDMVDVYLEEATHLVWTSPEVADAWARLRELVPDAQLQALRAEMDARGYAEGVLDEEAFNEIARTKGFEWLTRSEWRKFWDAVKAAVRRILGLTDPQEIDRVSARLVSYAIANQQSMTEEAAASGESREGSPFRVDDIARASIADTPSPDERTFAEAMAARQESPNLPGTPAARATNAPKEKTRAKMAPAEPEDQLYVAKEDAPTFAAADAYLDSTPLDVALKAAQTGVGLPAGMEPGSDNFAVIVGGLIERLTKAIDTTTNEFAKARMVQMAQDAARLYTQEGTQTARALRIRGQVNKRLLPIAPILAREKIMVEQMTRVIDQRFTEDPTEKVRATVNKAGKDGGDNLSKALDEEAPAEDITPEQDQALTAAERQAQRLIYRAEEKLRQGSKDLITNKDGDTINRAFREQVTDPMEQQAFRDRLKALNVGETVADRLFLTASREAQDKAAMKVYHAARNLRRKTDTLLTKDSPALARLLNDLRKKMFPGMKWGDILTELPDHQRERQLAIYDRIRQDERLQDLTDEEVLQLTNELDKAWMREREKLIQRELDKAGALGAKAPVDIARVKAAMPRLLRYINLGVFNSDAFREAIAPEYGFKVLTSAESQELRQLAQAAWHQPEGIQRNRALQKLLDRMQTLTGASKLELFESYWISSVLSGLRTQFDTWMATLNGFATVARLSLANPKAAPAIMGEWMKGIGEGTREAMQILTKGDFTYLKRFNEDMLKSLEGEKAMRPTPLSERLLKEGNLWQKFPAAVMVFVSRSMAAADHVNNTATSRGATAAAKALNPNLYKGVLKPTDAERASAQQQATREVTGGVPPANAAERATVSARTREILNAATPQASAEGGEIGNIAAYQNDPTGLFGGIYRMINWAFGTMEREAGKLATNEEADKFTRALAAVAAISARSVLGVRFARFGMNFASNSTSFVPGTYFAKNVLYGRDLSKSRESLIFVNNLIGVAAMGALYAAFSALGGDDDDYGLEGRWDTLTPERKRQLMSAGKMPLTYWWRGKDGNVNRISYRQWEIGSVFAAVGSMLDKKKYAPSEWKKESVASHLLSATGAGMAHVRDLSALAALSEILGKSAYATDAGEEIGKKINKVSANWVTAFLPNAFRDVDAWNDPQHYKAESNLDAWTRGVPVLRRQVAGGRPMLTLLGDPVELDRSPWSRVYTNASQDEGYQALGALHARGIWMPAPSTERIVRNANGDKVRISDLGGEAEWTYQKAVGKAYREYLKDNDADLRAMSVEDAEKQLAKDTERIRDDAARELEDSL